MKKTLFLAIMAGAALAGCVKNEAVAPGSGGAPERIAFEAPVVGVPVRATEIADNYPTDEEFAVYALYHENKFTSYTDGKLYMDNVECTNQTKSGDNPNEYWAPTTPYYWPKNGYLTFAAYAPKMDVVPAEDDGTATGVEWDNEGFTFQNFKVNDDPKKQIDLLYSGRVFDKKKGNEVTDNPGNYDGIQITFKHALSSIVFTAKALVAESVILTGITVDNIYSKGTFEQGLSFDQSENVGDSGTDNQNPQWSNYSDCVASYTIYDGAGNNTALATTEQRFTSDAAATGGKRRSDLLVLPQALNVAGRATGYTLPEGQAQKDATVTVTYKIKHGDEWLDQKTVWKLATGSDATPAYTWEINKRYTYAISIGLDQIYFSPKVEDYDDEPSQLL